MLAFLRIARANKLCTFILTRFRLRRDEEGWRSLRIRRIIWKTYAAVENRAIWIDWSSREKKFDKKTKDEQLCTLLWHSSTEQNWLYRTCWRVPLRFAVKQGSLIWVDYGKCKIRSNLHYNRDYNHSEPQITATRTLMTFYSERKFTLCRARLTDRTNLSCRRKARL